MPCKGSSLGRVCMLRAGFLINLPEKIFNILTLKQEYIVFFVY